MIREQAKKWLPEITHWANGGNLWWNDGAKWLKFNGKVHTFTGEIYIIEDKHFEARKAFALGESIEVKCGITTPFKHCVKPSWNSTCEYRPKPKHWYDTVSKENPALCWVWDNERNKKSYAEVIYEKVSDYFQSTLDNTWKNAEPIKPEECYKEAK